jgi:hypothetical protein
MSKTPFRMPQRQPGERTQLDQWVSGEDSASSGGGRPKRPEGKLARLTIDLPPDLHAKFKSICALKGTRMIDEVRGFIEDWTQKHG